MSNYLEEGGIQGEAAQWFARITRAHLTWSEFRTLFKTEFIHVETPAALFLLKCIYVDPNEKQDCVTVATEMLGVLDAQIQK